MISDSLSTYLKAQVSAVANKVYPLVIPQQTYDEVTKQPCLVYTIDTDVRHVRFAGTDSLVRGILQVDCYARSYQTVQDVAASVRDALARAANTSPLTSTTIKTIHLEGENNLTDEEPGLYRVLQRYVVWYDEA
jgi:hypothetical protein